MMIRAEAVESVSSPEGSGEEILFLLCYNRHMKLKKTQLVQLNQIQSAYQLSLIVLHGSYVKGKVHAKSDLDIGVVRKNPHQPLSLIDLINDLRRVFRVTKIDVVDLTHADPLLLYAVLSYSQLLCGSLSDYQQLQLKAFHRYQDYQPFLRQEADFVREKLNTYVTT